MVQRAASKWQTGPTRRGAVKVSARMRLCVVKALYGNNNGTHFLLFTRQRVRKHYRPQLSRCKSPGGRRETTCYERRLGNLKAAAWTGLEQDLSSARLHSKHIISSCQRFSPLLKTKVAKLKRGTEARPAQVIPHKSSLAIMTIEFYIQISMSNKILMHIQRLIMHPFSGGIFFLFFLLAPPQHFKPCTIFFFFFFNGVRRSLLSLRRHIISDC